MEFAGKQLGGNSAAHATGTGNVDGDGPGWDNLTNLTKFMHSAEQDPEVDSGFTGLASKLMGAAGGAHPTQAAAQQGADPAVLDKLLGVYQQTTGNQFGGSDSEFSMLSQLASKMTGNPIGEAVLKKLIQYKMQSMF